eukprot:TRINITY_DN4926_c0_g1_i2.p2 TRINITY_DN4926_c0_g1~~TRINITY_DN4926_c0_g1_i2.p2  ORF type:complete len:169 (+),score=63.22 TRINITY_DN4926_c0_g1_i2:185-691(+)
MCIRDRSLYFIEHPGMALTLQPASFQHIVRLLNTNIDGKRKIPFALRVLRGIGIRFAYMICKKTNIDVNRRAGTLTPEECEKISDVVADPQKYKIPTWFLNRQRDPKTGTVEHVTSSAVATKLRDDIERLRKMRCHRGVRHAYGIRVRGQHTCTSGRRGKVMGVAKKK